MLLCLTCGFWRFWVVLVFWVYLVFWNFVVFWGDWVYAFCLVCVFWLWCCLVILVLGLVFAVLWFVVGFACVVCSVCFLRVVL